MNHKVQAAPVVPLMSSLVVRWVQAKFLKMSVFVVVIFEVFYPCSVVKDHRRGQTFLGVPPGELSNIENLQHLLVIGPPQHIPRLSSENVQRRFA